MNWPFGDDRRALRRHAFVVEGECAESGTMLQARIADHVDDLRAVTQRVQLVEREEAHAGIVGLDAQHAIELDRMADRFVNLQPELAAIEDEIESAFRAGIGGVQRDRLFGDARRVTEQVELVDEFVAFQLILAAERIRVAPLLNFVVLEAERSEAGACDGPRLVDTAADGRCEILPLMRTDKRRLCECDPFCA